MINFILMLIVIILSPVIIFSSFASILMVTGIIMFIIEMIKESVRKIANIIKENG